MTALLYLIGVGCLLLGGVALLEPGGRRIAFALFAGGVAAIILARMLTVYFRYREAFVKARRGAKQVAREHRREGFRGYVPRSREALFLRRLVPGAKRRAEEALVRLVEAIDPYVPELAARRERLVKVEYGREDLSAWDRKLGEFIEGVVLDEVAEADLDRAVPFVYRWYAGVEQDDARATRYGRWDRRMYSQPDGPLAVVIEKMVAEYMASDAYRSAAGDADELDPAAYELHCARVLRECGWSAEVLGGTGDQGVDVIAERGRTRIVIQCKKYSRSVGNKAVQEVIGGRMMHRAQAAAVVSNASYTRSAQELARMTKVLLLHHTELVSLDQKLAAMGLLKPEPAAETG